MTIEDVRAEWHRFCDALPELMKTLEGRWVVFKDGGVVADFDDERTAFREAMKRFGPKGGAVVAQVKPIVARPITASAIYPL